MNLLDLALAVAAVVAVVGGWRLGLVARVFSWLGIGIALVIGIRFVPRVVTAFGGSDADGRVTVAVCFLVLVAAAGQAIGLAAGALVHRFLPARQPLPWWDRAAGALVGLLGVLLLVWMVIPSLATAKGWPARAARDSVVVGVIEDYGPQQPARFAAWGRSVSDAPFPSVLGALDDPSDPGEPPVGTLDAAVDARARASTVKVSGQACSQIQEGSGWVADPGVVVTNAHVVAGERSTTVTDELGDEHDARVIAFDPMRDLAVLLVPSLGAPALPLETGAVGTVGAVYGHPGGGPLVAAPARVGEEIVAVGTDITRTRESRREVYVLAADLRPGDSGGPLVDSRGAVIGVAFAVDPGRATTGYALTETEVRRVLADALSGPRGEVGTGGCLVG